MSSSAHTLYPDVALMQVLQACRDAKGSRAMRRSYVPASLSPSMRQRSVYDGPKPKGMMTLHKGRADSREARHASVWLGIALLALLGVCSGMHVAGMLLTEAGFPAAAAPGVARYGAVLMRNIFSARPCSSACGAGMSSIVSQANSADLRACTVHADRLCLLGVAVGLLARILLSSRGKGLALLTVTTVLGPVIGFCTRGVVERESGVLAWLECAVGGALTVVGLCIFLPGARLQQKRAATVCSGLGILSALLLCSLSAVFVS